MHAPHAGPRGAPARPFARQLGPGQPARVRRCAAGNRARLDPKHSHLILVDDGSEGEFGREIEFRGLFEAHVRQPRGAGDEAFIVKTMRERGIGWEGSTEAAAPTPPWTHAQPRPAHLVPSARPPRAVRRRSRPRHWC